MPTSPSKILFHCPERSLENPRGLGTQSWRRTVLDETTASSRTLSSGRTYSAGIIRSASNIMVATRKLATVGIDPMTLPHTSSCCEADTKVSETSSFSARLLLLPEKMRRRWVLRAVFSLAPPRACSERVRRALDSLSLADVRSRSPGNVEDDCRRSPLPTPSFHESRDRRRTFPS